MTVNKSKGNEAFLKLDKKRKDAVIMLFENTLTVEEIAKKLSNLEALLKKQMRLTHLF